MSPEDGVRVSVHAGRSGLTESAVLARLLGGPEALTVVERPQAWSSRNR